ncbi:CHAD domain-containing protein [Methylomonas sp. HYX-M1]|uniref:CHAD domain-containing protein n=1 Tax=Methylomonas sp. HYX-M1 TaxID=3139307 RepID=UPI00345C4626
MAKEDAKLIQAALERHWAKHLSRLQACRNQASESAVHKLRISLRRLLAFIELLQILAPDPALRKLRKDLKSQVDGFDELRDTQVMLADLLDLNALPEIAPFLAYLRANERRLLAAIPRQLHVLDSNSQELLLAKVQKRVLPALREMNLPRACLAAIDAVYAVALQRYRAIDAQQPQTLHKLRIALKKLRYLLITASELLPPLPDGHLASLQTYLTLLGDIQNSCVRREYLNRYFGHQPPPALAEIFAERHQLLLDAFWLERPKIATFWRLSDKHPWPWDNKGMH